MTSKKNWLSWGSRDRKDVESDIDLDAADLEVAATSDESLDSDSAVEPADAEPIDLVEADHTEPIDVDDVPEAAELTDVTAFAETPEVDADGAPSGKKSWLAGWATSRPKADDIGLNLDTPELELAATSDESANADSADDVMDVPELVEVDHTAPIDVDDVTEAVEPTDVTPFAETPESDAASTSKKSWLSGWATGRPKADEIGFKLGRPEPELAATSDEPDDADDATDGPEFIEADHTEPIEVDDASDAGELPDVAAFAETPDGDVDAAATGKKGWLSGWATGRPKADDIGINLGPAELELAATSDESSEADAADEAELTDAAAFAETPEPDATATSKKSWLPWGSRDRTADESEVELDSAELQLAATDDESVDADETTDGPEFIEADYTEPIEVDDVTEAVEPTDVTAFADTPGCDADAAPASKKSWLPWGSRDRKTDESEVELDSAELVAATSDDESSATSDGESFDADDATDGPEFIEAAGEDSHIEPADASDESDFAEALPEEPVEVDATSGTLDPAEALHAEPVEVEIEDPAVVDANSEVAAFAETPGDEEHTQEFAAQSGPSVTGRKGWLPPWATRRRKTDAGRVEHDSAHVELAATDGEPTAAVDATAATETVGVADRQATKIDSPRRRFRRGRGPDRPEVGGGLMRPFNLLPKREVVEKKPAIGIGRLAAIGAVVVGIVGLGVWYAAEDQSRSNAETERDDLVELLEQPAPAAGGVSVGQAQRALFADQLRRTDAIAAVLNERVGWDRVLTSVAQVFPQGTWFTGMTASAAPALPEATADADTPVDPVGQLPRLSVSGFAEDHEQLAVLMGRLTALRELEDVQLESSGSTLIGKTEVVQFSVSAAVTPGRTS